MRRPAQFFILFVLLVACLSLPRVTAQDMPLEWLLTPEELKTDAGSIVRAYDVSYRMVEPGKAVEKVHKVVTILGKKGNSEASVGVWYDKDVKISDMNVRAYHGPGEPFFTAKKISDFEDQLYISQGQFFEDNRVRFLDVPCTGYPCTVEWEYERKLQDMASINYPSFAPQDYYQSVQSATFTVELPADNELDFRGHGVGEPVVTEGEKTVTYAWSVGNLPAHQAESYSPPSAVTLPYLRFSLRDIKIDGYTGTFTDWEAYGRFQRQLYDGRQELPDLLRAKVRELTDGVETDTEKIDRLYRLLQERTRYVGIQLGIGGWQPFTAKYVDENRYGDCKALSNYMGAMLSEVGIESYPVVIQWGPEYYPVSPEFTTSAFNHVVLYVPDEDMYLECTSSDSPTGYLGEGKHDRHAVHLAPGGGKLIRTPTLKPAENGYLRNVDLTLREDGSTGFKLRCDYYGAQQEDLRRLPRQQSNPNEQLKWLQAGSYIPDVSGRHTLTPAQTAPVTHFTYETDIKKYGRSMGSRRFLPLNEYKGMRLFIPEPDDHREFEIDFDKTRFYVDSITLHLPNNYELEAVGDHLTELDHEIGSYRSTITPTEDGLRWVRTLKLTPARLPAEAYERFRTFLVAVQKADNRQVVVKEKRTK